MYAGIRRAGLAGQTCGASRPPSTWYGYALLDLLSEAVHGCVCLCVGKCNNPLATVMVVDKTGLYIAMGNTEQSLYSSSALCSAVLSR